MTPPGALLDRRLLDRLRERGIKLWADDGQLRYRAPAGALDAGLRAEIAEAKPALLALLEEAAGPDATQLPPPARPARRTPTAKPASHPLSFAQQRFWFLDQATPGNPAFNLPYVLRLTGTLDADVLRTALGILVRRHDALRTTFTDSGGEPAQVVAPAGQAAAVELPVTDLTSRPDQDKAAREHIDAEFRVGFDLARGPLLRSRLLRRGRREHLLLLTFHHIVFDGWSYPVFLAELAELYRAGLAGTQPSLPPVEFTYTDYAAWQRDWLDGPALAAGLDTWRKLLTEMPSALDLPTDRPRPTRQTFAGAVVPVGVPGDVTAALTRLGHQEGATLFMVLLAAYAVLLARTSGQPDLLVGTPVAGRPAAEWERLIGFFVNMLPLRADLRGRPTFRQLLRQVRETTLQALAAQHVPFERLVEEFAPERDLSRTPLFSTMLALQNLPTAKLELPGLRAQPVFGPAGVAKYDLSLVLVPAGDGLDGAMEYNTDLFDAGTAERFVAHLNTVLRGIAAEPDARVDDVPLADAAELHCLRAEWNATVTEVPEPCLTDLLRAAAERHPAAMAIAAPDGNLTYAELHHRADAAAAALRRAGAGPGTIVGLLCERSAATVVNMLGILRAGAAYLPLDPAYPADRLAFTLGDAGAPLVVVTTAAMRDRVPADFGGMVLELGPQTSGEYPEDVPAPAPDDPAYVIYTSGSTGRPKGVVIPHRAVANYLTSMSRTPGMGPDDVVLSVISFAFDFSVLEIFLPLVTGAQLVIAGDEAGDGTRLARRLDTSGATWMSATPTTWRMLLEGGWSGRPGLTACAGGEPLTPELARQLLARTAAVWNLYGPTETTVFSTLEAVSDPGRITIGRPIANTQVYVLDDRMRPQPIGVAGEICIGGAGVADGYAGRPALTAERFVPDDLGPFPGRRLYRTGDAGRWLADGRLECLGRRDGQVKLRGYRIETGEVATVLEQCPGVSRAAVVLRPDRVGDPQLVGYVTAAPGEDRPTARQLREHAARRLPGYMVPATFAVLDALPSTPNGKLDPAALPDPAQGPGAGPADAARTQARTPTEQRVAAAWTAVLGLGLDALDIDDDFFVLGGESMKAVRVVRRIDPQLPVLDLFTHPTIRTLAAHIDDRAGPNPGSAGRPLVVRLRSARGAVRTRLVCVPFGGGSAVSFEPLARCAPDDWEVCAVELPGHDYARRDEPLVSLPEVARRCAAEIAGALPAEVVLYGHCVGSALAVAIAAELEAAGCAVRGVVAGASFPAARLPGAFGRLTRLLARQNARAVQDSLRVLGGLGESLPSAEQNLLARNLRHDAHQAERFFAGATVRLAAPLLAVTGGADRLTEFAAERVRDWDAVAGHVRLAILPGAEHFFVRERPAELMRLLVDWPSAAAEPAAPGPATPAVPARLRSFLLVAGGQLVSLIGTGLSTFALGVWAYQHTGSVTAFAGIATVSLLPAIVVAPLAGAAADRLDRRRVMLGCDAAGLLTALLLLGLVAAGWLQLWELYAIAAVSATAGAFRQPAYLAGATQLVPKRYLGSASGLLQLGGASGTIVAQLLGGAVITLVGLRGAAALDAVTFLVALGTLLAVRFPDALFARRPEPLGREIAAGARFILRRPPLVALTVFFTGANALGGLLVVLITPLLLAVASPAALGGVLAMQGAGMLAGGALMALWGGARRRSLGMLAAVVIFGASALLVGVAPRPVIAAAGMAGVGVCAALASAHWLALVQVKVPVPMQGRVISSCLMLARAMMPLAYLAAGPLVSAAGRGTRGIALVMAVTGLLALAWSAAGYLSRPLRLADDLLPDALLDLDAPGAPPC